MQDFNNQINDINKGEKDIISDFDTLYENITNIEEIIDNTEVVCAEIETKFMNETSLNKQDLEFLFVTIAMQCCRWLIQPKLDLDFEKISKENRHDASKDGAKEKKEARLKSKEEKYQDKTEFNNNKYPSKKEILLDNVPYDAMEGTKHIVIPGVTEYGKNISGKNHHVATKGHDPILGYLFGTANILTKTITFNTPKKLITNPVTFHAGTRQQYVINENIGLTDLFRNVCESLSEDFSRLQAAVVKQVSHMQSDKYTKQGLPIPILPPELSQKLLNSGWNSYEAERLLKHFIKNAGVVTIQGFLSLLINSVIEILYFLTNEKNDINTVKCKKIISCATVISSSSNIIYSLFHKDLTKLDVGGLIVGIHRIYNDRNVIAAIQQEFIESNFLKIIADSQEKYKTINIENNFAKNKDNLDYEKFKADVYSHKMLYKPINYKYIFNVLPKSRNKIAQEAKYDARCYCNPAFENIKVILEREKNILQVESEVNGEILNELKTNYKNLFEQLDKLKEFKEVTSKLEEISELENKINKQNVETLGVIKYGN